MNQKTINSEQESDYCIIGALLHGAAFISSLLLDDSAFIQHEGLNSGLQQSHRAINLCIMITLISLAVSAEMVFSNTLVSHLTTNTDKNGLNHYITLSQNMFRYKYACIRSLRIFSNPRLELWQDTNVFHIQFCSVVSVVLHLLCISSFVWATIRPLFLSMFTLSNERKLISGCWLTTLVVILSVSITAASTTISLFASESM